MSSLNRNYLFAMDFDGCLAATFMDSPNGMNVHEASSRAVSEIFGKAGIQVYEDIGGLKNREPGELVRSIQQGLGISVQDGSTKELVEAYIAIKLSNLVGEISSEWPQLYLGVKEFFQAVAEERLPITTAIVSSGHDTFIEEVFKINNLPLPHILVTSDIIREKPMPERERYKPYPYQLAVAHNEWRRNSFVVDENYKRRNQGKSHIMYIGDDPIKDGGLAEQSRVIFGFVPFTRPGYIPDSEKGQLLVPNFFMLRNLLLQHGGDLHEGRSLSSILLGRKDDELFHPLTESEKPYARWLRDGNGRGERGF